MNREDMTRALNVLNNSSITHTKSQMRNRNQMMSRVQRKEDMLFNGRIENEKAKIISNISKIDGYECELSNFNQAKSLLAQRTIKPMNGFSLEPTIELEPVEPSYPSLDTFNIPSRNTTRFLRGKR